jgi:hypothetical protein
MQAKGNREGKPIKAANTVLYSFVVLVLPIKKEVKEENIRSLEALLSQVALQAAFGRCISLSFLLSPAAFPLAVSPCPRFALCSAPALTYKYASSGSPCPS